MIRILPFAVAAFAVPTLAAGPLQVATRILVEQRTAAADGSVRTRLVPADRAVPGDRVTVQVSYRNGGAAPIANLAIVNPVPAGLAYRGGAAGSTVPDVSADGIRFAPLAALSVAGRPATAADITQVRWRLASPVAPGSGGQFAFQAVLK